VASGPQQQTAETAMAALHWQQQNHLVDLHTAGSYEAKAPAVAGNHSGSGDTVVGDGNGPASS